MLPNGQISSADKNDVVSPFLMLAFRPFFLLGALFSALSIGVWGLTFTGHIEFSPLGGSLFWHTHEMLFGFAVAIISGFLLTAVQTWTGVPSVNGKPLAMLVLIWLTARILFAFPLLISDFGIMLIDLSFLPLVAVFLAIPIIKVRMWRNLFFVPLLLLMAFLNGLLHLSAQGTIAISFLTLSHAMVLMITLIMCIMGGRVFPMFTASGTHTARVASVAWLDNLAVVSVAVCVLVSFEIFARSPVLEASVFITAGILNFVRVLRWRIWVTLKTPLVWSLHLSYWSLCAGLVMLGLEKLGLLTSVSLAFHTITIGGIGLMILSMIARVSLGHTGRTLQISKAMVFAFSFIILALVARVLGPLLFSSHMILILLAAACWVIAYGTFVVVYFPILTTARIDRSAVVGH